MQLDVFYCTEREREGEGEGEGEGKGKRERERERERSTKTKLNAIKFSSVILQRFEWKFISTKLFH